MLNRVSQNLASIKDFKVARNLAPVLSAMADNSSTVALATAGLAITAAAGTTAKIGATPYYAFAGGRLVTIAASTVMPALTGLSISATAFNVVSFFVTAAGVVSALFGTQGATLGAVTMPNTPLGQALVGILIITNSATFTGGTTALDTATTVYLSPIGSVDPSLIF